ncbi:SPATA4, partial [Symbiodinium pilosum]
GHHAAYGRCRSPRERPGDEVSGSTKGCRGLFHGALPNACATAHRRAGISYPVGSGPSANRDGDEVSCRVLE